ncbi:MAG TPA: molybdopterin-synthase adenylyltransferase MoeB, partial [Solirubrobacterales bacterium]|nr:molybdopterin-synthase adenylyltransferase MoeB [Solirubrobacterales bacterium]
MATDTERVQTIEEIEPFEAAEEINGGDVVLIDTREPHEYQEAHLEGGKLVPPGLLADEIAAAAPDKSARTILYCRSGNRSAIAAAQLQQLGYENVASMSGGILQWQEQGLPVVAAHGMTPEQRERYSRHILLPEVGVDGQVKLLNAKVLLLGAGGLGAPTALYLAAAGVGTLGLIDDDVVDASNLQRQVIHNTERIGMPKTASARVFVEALNPDVNVVEHNLRLSAENILDIIKDYDIIVDGADNFPIRYLLNDASVRLRKPVVSASILGFDGQISTFVPFEGPCYRCLYPTPPPAELAPSCSANGVLGVMAGTMGTLQANEVIKLVLGAGGLGAPTALYLAAAGVGTLGLVDDDVVDASNLQRQVIHNTERIGMPKTTSARIFIEQLNPDVNVVEHNGRLHAGNILEVMEDYDIVVDGADNFPTRYLLNDASVRLRKPVVSASILGFDGQISTFVPYEGPCYRCLFPTPPPAELAPSCSANGVLGVMAGTMGTLQAN